MKRRNFTIGAATSFIAVLFSTAGNAKVQKDEPNNLLEPFIKIDLAKNYSELMSFHYDGQWVGGIRYIDGVLTFDGAADESAKIFCDALAKHIKL